MTGAEICCRPELPPLRAEPLDSARSKYGLTLLSPPTAPDIRACPAAGSPPACDITGEEYMLGLLIWLCLRFLYRRATKNIAAP